MLINHLIVGAKDFEKTAAFYCDLFGFKKTDDDPGAQGGLVLANDNCELLVIPFPEYRLPNPAHFAFEVSTATEFNTVFIKAEQMGLSPRSTSSRDSTKGPSEFIRGQQVYKIFYVYDPTGINVECMVRIAPALSIFDPIHIDTKHVKIRPLQTVTWKKLAEDLLYENSFHALFWGVKTPEDMKKRYEDSISAFNSKKGNPIVFFNMDETEVLGMTNFMNVEPANKMIEIGGTWINKKYQRTYVNTETKLALLQYAFETLKLNRVEFRIDSDNVASQKAVQRLGFHFDGLMPRRKVNANNDVRDYVFYSVTDQTWPVVKKQINDLIEKYK